MRGPLHERMFGMVASCCSGLGARLSAFRLGLVLQIPLHGPNKNHSSLKTVIFNHIGSSPGLLNEKPHGSWLIYMVQGYIIASNVIGSHPPTHLLLPLLLPVIPLWKSAPGFQTLGKQTPNCNGLRSLRHLPAA